MNPSSKRVRRTSAVIQVGSCLVDGCNSDLSICREYHRRHKVCELHSKTPKVTIQGQEKRFCQQCSRFHSLGEFDEGKRSCRRRLAGHNKRRRKPPQLKPMTTSLGTFLSDHQGKRFSPFSSPQINPTHAAMNSAWGASFSGSMPYHGYQDGMLSKTFLDTNFELGNYGNNLQPLYRDEIFGEGVESSRVRSLLSSTPAVRKESNLDLKGQQTSSIYSAQSFMPRLHQYNNALRMQEGEAVMSNIVSDGSNSSNLLYHK